MLRFCWSRRARSRKLRPLALRNSAGLPVPAGSCSAQLSYVSGWCKLGCLGSRRSKQLAWPTSARKLGRCFASLTWGSISTCSSTLNVPANCVANIAVNNRALSVLMRSTLAGDAVCNKTGTIDKRVNKQIARFEEKKDRAKIEATQFLKRQGYDVAVLPRPPTISNRAVYRTNLEAACKTGFGK